MPQRTVATLNQAGQSFVWPTYANLAADLSFTGSYTGLTAAVEGSDDAGASWNPVAAFEKLAGSVGGGLLSLTPANGTAHAYYLRAQFPQYRFRVVAISGGACVVVFAPLWPGTASDLMPTVL